MSDTLPRYSDQMPGSPVLTSYEAEWSSASLEHYRLPAGEAPTRCFDHHVIAMTLGQDQQVDVQMDGVAKGRLQRLTLFNGSVLFTPMQHCNWARWEQEVEGIILNLKTELLTRNAADLLGVDQVELLPQANFHDPLILQIALALKADLESHRSGGRLYAEAMSTALAVHLVRNYSSHRPKSVHGLGGLSPTSLQLVTDYIHDYLDRDLGLEELAAIVQLSPHHFCRSFKQSTGFSPHQYLIRQRVERAKLLLKGGKMEIREVAIACGFTHQSHLNRHFKRLMGITPKKFANS
jgi:AraC family transcriptional regulator